MNWSSGYVTEVEYVFGYYHQLNPALLRLACLRAGFHPPSGEPLHYLELGYGQGLSINIHGAAMPGSFMGTDFNPAHVAHAQAFARASRSDVVLLDDSFAELAARKDLQAFDIIALHGVWTWVSDDDRRTIVDIIRRRLKIGGLVYNSYNCRPGWAPAEPLRHLMRLYSDLATTDAAGTLSSVDRALKFCEQIAESDALYFNANPLVDERLKQIMSLNRNYVAHEYFNRNWELMSFSQMAEWMEAGKVTYVASAGLLDHLDAINLTDKGRQLLADVKHPVLRESVRDYLVNQQFRRDIFMKGPQRLSQLDQFELLQRQAFVLTTWAHDVPLKVKGARGEFELQEQVYRPLVEALAEGSYAAKTLAELRTHPNLRTIHFPNIVQAIFVLIGMGHAFPAQSPTKEARRRCASLNKYLCERARSMDDVSFLASPITATGVFATRLHQLFLRAIDLGRTSLADQVADVWSLLSAQGQGIKKDGQRIDNAADNVAELTRLATEFQEKRLPVLKALGVSLR